MNNRFLTYVLIFLSAWLLVSFFTPKPTQTPVSGEEKPIVLEASKRSYALGEPVIVSLRNTTGEEIHIREYCPEAPLTVYYKDDVVRGATAFQCPEEIQVPGTGAVVIDYSPWSREVFGEVGDYRIAYTGMVDGEEKTYTTSFTIEPKGFFGSIWDTVFYRPIYNVLIFLTTIVPGASLGLAIVLLTIIFRIILLIPNQRALESQRSMQKMQPELKAIQEKYKDNQQQLAQETMKLWKKHKVNPFGSCLPLLIQLPILIALYYAVQNGTNVSSVHLLYEPLKHVNVEHIVTMFIQTPWYVLDLALRDPFVLPILVAVLQFIQMRLALPKTEPKTLVVPKDGDTAMPDMQMVGRTMTYTLPVLLGFMTATFPAGVGLYWLVNTLFGIGQQLVVNASKK